jgi:hypothetical protein
VITIAGVLDPELSLGYSFPNTATIVGNAPLSSLRRSTTSVVMVIIPHRAYLPVVIKR